MAIFDSAAQADALCTVITLGFIYIAKGETYIIFHDGKDDAGEDARHGQLQAKLEKLGIPISFKIKSAEDKSYQPVILARTEYQKLQGDVLGDIRDLLNRFEEEVNRESTETGTVPLRGAYVGGALLAGGKAELLEPSILHCYEPAYREVSADVERSYQSARSVTTAVQRSLQSKFGGGSTGRKNGFSLCRPTERPLAADMPESTKGVRLFGSVHGMTQSMLHYGGTFDTSKVNMELALSKDTCKVASCIPCSIFMRANGTPASATHFGRGDNWNFPNNIFQQIRKCPSPEDLEALNGYPYVKNWMHTVSKAYDAGKERLTTALGPRLPEELAYALGLDRNKIPQMFLEALTFEGSFLSRLLNTLNKVPGESGQA